MCGRLVGHLSVFSWFYVTCRILKRRESLVMKGWDNETRDALLQCKVSETVGSVQWDDPPRGDWCIDSQELNVWVNVSRVALEGHETVLEDAYWLQPENNAQHINLIALDTVLKGINLALQWQSKVLHMKTNSVCVYIWVSNTLTGRA